MTDSLQEERQRTAEQLEEALDEFKTGSITKAIRQLEDYRQEVQRRLEQAEAVGDDPETDDGTWLCPDCGTECDTKSGLSSHRRHKHSDDDDSDEEDSEDE